MKFDRYMEQPLQQEEQQQLLQQQGQGKEQEEVPVNRRAWYAYSSGVAAILLVVAFLYLSDYSYFDASSAYSRAALHSLVGSSVTPPPGAPDNRPGVLPGTTGTAGPLEKDETGEDGAGGSMPAELAGDVGQVATTPGSGAHSQRDWQNDLSSPLTPPPSLPTVISEGDILDDPKLHIYAAPPPSAPPSRAPSPAPSTFYPPPLSTQPLKSAELPTSPAAQAPGPSDAPDPRHKLPPWERGHHPKGWGRHKFRAPVSPPPPHATWIPRHFSDDPAAAAKRPGLSAECDLYSGRWVYDERYPLWDWRSCPFNDVGFNCQRLNRSDSFYMAFRWQPHGCNIPRFNAAHFRHRMKGRRMVFVGDSLGRNQFESMMCMLSHGINASRVHEATNSPITKHMGALKFTFEEFNFTVEYYRSPFLIVYGHPTANYTDAEVHAVLKLDYPDHQWSRDAVGADVMVFNNGHWWSTGKTTDKRIYFEVNGTVDKEMDVSTAYLHAMETWADWVETRVDLRKTQVFMRGYAPVHFRHGAWNTGGNCDDKHPLWDESLVEEGSMRPWFRNATLDVLDEMHAPVTFLDITYMTAFRSDGHIGNSGYAPGVKGHDCSHWCLPGVPDIWNEVLYAELLTSGKPPFDKPPAHGGGRTK
eukprot:jgi/Mesen1/2516/ME000016S01868